MTNFLPQECAFAHGHSTLYKLQFALESSSELLKMKIPGPHFQEVHFSESGAGPKKLHP